MAMTWTCVCRASESLGSLMFEKMESERMRVWQSWGIFVMRW